MITLFAFRFFILEMFNRNSFSFTSKTNVFVESFKNPKKMTISFLWNVVYCVFIKHIIVEKLIKIKMIEIKSWTRRKKKIR